MRKSLSILSIPIILIAGCMSEDDASKIHLASQLSSDTAYSAGKLRIDISASSLDSRLSRLQISSFDNENGEIMLKDSTLNTKEMRYTYLYEVPELETDTVAQEIRLFVEDADGNSSSLRKNIVVVKKDYLLKELSGIVMYQEGNNSPNGFSLKSLLPVMTSVADSADIDIVAFDDETTRLTREWHTNTDVYFAKSNSFDYAKASSSTVSAAYSSSVGYHKVTGIDDGDIILVGRGTKAEGVIHVVLAIDDGNRPRYMFNIKPMQR